MIDAEQRERLHGVLDEVLNVADGAVAASIATFLGAILLRLRPGLAIRHALGFGRHVDPPEDPEPLDVEFREVPPAQGRGPAR